MAGQYTTTCKDCNKTFYYSEASFLADRERGYSRPERCPDCRRQRQREINASGIGYYPVKLVADLPPGFAPVPGVLGRVHHDLRPHKREEIPSRFAEFSFGITDDDIRQLYATLDDCQVVVVEGPTGSGKSTFLPYRLMVAPAGVRDPGRFTRAGQIVVTQPRRLPTSAIPKFVAEKLHGSGLGPGFDVGYKHAGSAETDRRNRLVFVTDGTLINWIVSEQISQCSVIMIDEAHERSVNIDLILGMLRARLPRYPNLKLIIASATIKADDFVKYFETVAKIGRLCFKGLEKKVAESFAPTPVFDYEQLVKKSARMIDEAAAKAVTQKALEVLRRVLASGPEWRGDVLAFAHSENCVDLVVEQLQAHIEKARELAGVEVFPLYRNLTKHRQELALKAKAHSVADKVLKVLDKRKRGKDRRPILALSLDRRTVEGACERLEEALRDLFEKKPREALPPEAVEIRLVHEELTPEEQRAALEGPRTKEYLVVLASYVVSKQTPLPLTAYEIVEDWRVIVATNIAETSLTVDGVVHVIDTGLIKQNVFDPTTRTERLQTMTHSQSGCHQRLGRAGRIRPGFAHYLYTEAQFLRFVKFTPPETQRAPLEDLYLAARAAGLANPAEFKWLQETEAVETELKQARQALQQRGALDDEGDLTEQGLELREMTLEPEVAHLLLNADRFCCALEMATVLPFLTLQLSLRGGLFRWEGAWDAQTRWEARRRQHALRVGCADDMELILKTWAAWEASGRTMKDRQEWAARFLVNTDTLAGALLDERTALIQRLALGTRGKVTRALNLDLLDRLRMVMAYSLPERVTEPDKLEMESDSVCRETPPSLVTFLRRVPYKVENTGERRVRAAMLSRIDEKWLVAGPLSGLDSLGLARAMAETTRDEHGALRPARAWRHLAVTQFPMESVYECNISKTGEVRASKWVAWSPPLREQMGRTFNLPEEVNGLEDESLRPEREGRKPAPAHREAIEKSTIEVEVGETPIELMSTASLRLMCVNAPPEGLAVDIYLDDKEEKEFEAVPVVAGFTPKLEIPPGEHWLRLRQAGVPRSDQKPAEIFLRSLEAEKEYVAALVGWQASGPDDYYVWRDDKPETSAGKAAVRWVFLGQWEKRLEAHVGERQLRPAGYYLFVTDQPLRFALYASGAGKNTPPLAEGNWRLEKGRAYTVICAKSNGSGPPRLTLVSDPTEVETPASWLNVATRAQLIGERAPHASGESFHAEVTGYQLGEADEPIVLFRPVSEKSPFELFLKKYKEGESVAVIPVAVDEYPEQRQAALIVREPLSGLEMAVPAEALLFDSWGAGVILRDWLALPKLILEVEAIDRKRRRIYLTLLERLAKALDELMDEAEAVQVAVTVVEVAREGRVAGVVVRVPVTNELALGALIWEAGWPRNATRAWDSFAPGEAMQAQLKRTGGRVKVGRVPFEMLEAARKTAAGGALRMEGGGGERKLELERPMTAEELAELLTVSADGDYRWAMVELYRRSNQPRADFVDRELLTQLDGHFPPGTLVSGCRVTNLRERIVEAQTSSGLVGTVAIAEWTNEWVSSLLEVTKIGDELTLMVVDRKALGELRLSRVQAALAELTENQIFRCMVIEVSPQQVRLRMVETEQGEQAAGLVGWVWGNHLAYELPLQRGTKSRPIVPTVGEKVWARVLEVNRVKRQVKLTIRHAFTARLFVVQAASVDERFATLFRRSYEIKQATRAEFWANEVNPHGERTIMVNAPQREGLEAAMKAIRQILPMAR